MTVGEVVKLLSYGQQYQLIGAQSGKKLANSWNNKKSIGKFDDCVVPDDGCMFSSFRTYECYVTKTPDSIYPIFCIWVSGK